MSHDKQPQRSAARMIVVRHDQQYEFTFQGETRGITGARLPATEAIKERARL